MLSFEKGKINLLPVSCLTCALASPLDSMAIFAMFNLPTLFAVPTLSTSLVICPTALIARLRTVFISSPSSSPTVLARVSTLSTKVLSFPFKVSAWAVAPPKNAPPSSVRFKNASLTRSAPIFPLRIADSNSSPCNPVIRFSSVVISTPLSNNCKFSSCCNLPLALICPKAVAIPDKSAPVAPAISESLFTLSASSSVSKPKAFNLFDCSISSLLVNGVTEPKSCNSLIILFVFSSEPVNTSKLFLWVSSSAVFTNTNRAVPTTANAASNGFNAPTKPLTPVWAVFADLPVSLNDLFDLSNRPFNAFVFLLNIFVWSLTLFKGLMAFCASTINLTVDWATETNNLYYILPWFGFLSLHFFLLSFNLEFIITSPIDQFFLSNQGS